MNTLKEKTENLVTATERLLQDFGRERTERIEEREKLNSRIKDLEAELEEMSARNTRSAKASEVSISNPINQSPDTVALSAENIDALVEEIDACLNLLKI
jgi:phage shock protein A